MPSFSFPRNERLKSQKAIQRLFKEGQSFSSFPFRLLYIFDTEDNAPFEVKFSATVPKKKFPKAVHRNRIRRQIKEAYRLEKHQLISNLSSELNGTLSIMMIYVAAESLPYAKLERAMKYLIKKTIRQLSQATN